MTRKLLFSVQAKDCRFDYFRGSGAGGQKRNKTSSAVRCTHIASKAVGQAQDERSQIQNKRLAFRRMAETTKFKNWIRVESARRLGTEIEVQKKVEEALQPSNLRVEGIRDGKWSLLE